MGYYTGVVEGVECGYYTSDPSYYIVKCSSKNFTVTLKTASDEGEYIWEVKTEDTDQIISYSYPTTIVDGTPPEVDVTGAPADWSKEDETADVACVDPVNGGVASGCKDSSERLLFSEEELISCPQDYDQYPEVPPLTIPNHSWLCGAALDKAGNIGFSNPVEFKVDKIRPISTIISPDAGSWHKEDFDVLIADSDTGDSGLNYCEYQVKTGPSLIITRDWTIRPCNDVVKLTVGPGEDCRDEGKNMCQINVKAYDNANNKGKTKYRKFSIDWSPPITEKWYEGPQYPIEDVMPKWITSDTLVYLDATDDTSGVKTTWYRNTLVDEIYCHNQTICQEAKGSGSWNEYTEPLNKTEESCHLIEYYSVDNVDKTEEVNRQCVFVDNTGPTPIKEVGDPKTECQGEQCEQWDWMITLFTPITLDCEDQGLHPVGEETLCYKIYLDGEDKTNEYCGELTDGWCCIDPPLKDFMFEQECTHRIEFYCIDKLGNEGPTDDEAFKVEGGIFTIQLNKKWNLISVPFVLLNDNPEEIFEDVADNMDSIWAYDGATDQWYVYTANGDPDTLTHIIPGWGYWVKMDDDDELLIGGSLMKPKVVPPIRKLIPGWNLIGYYGTDGQEGYYGPAGNGKEAYCALYSLVNTNSGLTQWSSLITYWEPDNPFQWKYLDQYDRMDPGAGYWIEMSVEDNYAPATVCPD